MNITEIQDLIKFVAKSGVTEVTIDKKDFKIIIKSEKSGKIEQQYIVQQSIPSAATQALPAATPVAASTPATPVADENDDSKYLVVKSPMIGTFYRSSGPDKESFVTVGQSIAKGDPVCIIEAMKLFNEIESEIAGKIVKVLVDDASPVEYDQPLFLVDPA